MSRLNGYIIRRNIAAKQKIVCPICTVGNKHNLSFYAVVVHPYVIFGTDCNQFYNPKMNFRRLLKDKNTLAILDKIADTYKEKRYGYEIIITPSLTYP